MRIWIESFVMIIVVQNLMLLTIHQHWCWMTIWIRPLVCLAHLMCRVKPRAMGFTRIRAQAKFFKVENLIKLL
jgi:hypothetical protein